MMLERGFILGIIFVIMLGGCVSKSNWLGGWHKKSNGVPLTAEGGNAKDVQIQPFLMAAEANGNFIVFAITNQTDREYRVSPAHFALIVQGTRQVVPYAPERAAIDVPSVLRPGETIQGRAIFYDYPAPEGHRLVFKPGAEAAFAVIYSMSNPIRSVPAHTSGKTESRGKSSAY